MRSFPDNVPTREPDAGHLVDAGWVTATGPRPDNQDRATASSRWAVVSDGAGGLPGGALAARLTVEAAVGRLMSAPRPVDHEIVAGAAIAANAAVRARQAADADVSTMAATLTLAAAGAIAPAGSTWHLVNVGDSPAWLVACGRGFERVTAAHNLAAELVRAGAISADEARHHPGRHIVTRAIGAADAVDVSPSTVRLRRGDALVLASDGIEVLGAAAMMEAMSGAQTAAQAAQRLVDAALAAGATDNVTVAVVRHRDIGGA